MDESGRRTRGVLLALLTATLAWALVVTVLRGIYPPNDFAEAHWLIDYRFGFLKRGLVGTVFAGLARLGIAAQTERGVMAAALLVNLLLGLLLLLASRRILERGAAHGSLLGPFLATAAFLVSPFVVMGANVLGYFDNLIVALALLAAKLALDGRHWGAAALAVVAVLVHEMFLLVGLPLVLFAAFLHAFPRAEPRRFEPARLIPYLLPLAAFAAVAVAGLLVDRAELVRGHAPRLASFGFVEKNRSLYVPDWLTRSLFFYLRQQIGSFLPRLTAPTLLAAVVPTVLVLLAHLRHRFRLRWGSPAGLAALAVTFSPLAIHAIAWDTPRIWTYVIFGAFGCYWLCSEALEPAGREVPGWLTAATVVVLVWNVFARFPLTDGDPERFTALGRALLYAPLVATAAVVWWRGRRLTRGGVAL